MRRILLILAFIVAYAGAGATGTWVKVTSDEASPQVTLNNSTIETSVFTVQVPGFWKNEVPTAQGNAWLLDLGNNIRTLEKGAPDLPYIATSLIIPDLANMKVEILSADYKDFQNVLIAPSKGNLYRDIDPESVPYEFGNQYERNDFYPGTLAKLNAPYIVRDFRGEAVWIMPFQYNPVTKVLRVYYNIKVKVSQQGTSTQNAFQRVKPLNKIDFEFDQLYKKHFLNYEEALGKYDPVGEQGNMLIISYGDFMDEMEPFIEWKKKRGIPVEIVDVATIGNNSNAIKQYVADYYNNNGLTFLLLVGDAAQVKSSYASGDSDNDYTYVVGNDHYPDLFCGRFSAENEDEVTTQVQRMLSYEMTPDVSDTAWFTKALGIGSDQGPGDDDEYDYQHVRNIQDNKLIPFTYNYGYELFDGSQGGNDEPGSPSPADVSAVLNSGVTIINYTGHGSTTSWGTTSFSNSNINNLNNAGKLPFIFSVACVNGNFVNNTCFAEAWLRATDADGNPTGAISVIMSTINQSWNPPMEGQDAMNDILAELVPDNIKRTFGGITMNGCMEMNDAYGSAGEEMTDTWTIFGDPSLMIRTAVPTEITANFQDVILIGSPQFVVNCPDEGALVTLNRDGEIMGSAVVENGIANITFDEPITLPGEAELVIVGFNKIPLIADLTIIAGDGPFIIYNSHYVNDSTTGNGNGVLDYNETAYLSVSMKNVGSEMANSVSTTLSTNDEFVTLMDSVQDFGAIDTAASTMIQDAYEIAVSPLAPDGHVINFSVTTIFDGDTSVSYFSETVHAPALNYVSYELDDSNGNGNGKLEPGETANVKVKVTNNGSSAAGNIVVNLSTETNWVSITQAEMIVGDMAAGDTAEVVYEITADGDTPLGFIANFMVNLTADFGISGEGGFSLIIGQKPVIVLKLGDISMSADSMMAAFTKLSVAADVVSEVPDDLYQYQCAFVLLGIYSDNHVLSEDEGAKLAAFLDGGGRIYMEGGDTWYYNTPTDVHPYFHINGTADGSSTFDHLVGDTSSFMKGFEFDYVGGNNWMDEIEPADTSAFVLLNNVGSDYNGPAVIAYENDTYKTIGSVCEFGGLVPGGIMGTGGNQAGYMALMLDFFGVNFTWTGIQNKTVNDPSAVKVYPNPFRQSVHFDVAGDLNDQATVIIYDMQGRTVKQWKLNSNSFVWNTGSDNLTQGVYFYKVINGNKITTGKLIYTR